MVRMSLSIPSISRPHGHQKPGQVPHFRLHGGVFDHRGAFGQGGGHHQVFGAGDRDRLEVNLRAAQAPGVGLHVALGQVDLHPHGLQALEVQVDGPGPDGAAAGQRHPGLAGPGHQGPQDQDRGPHGLHQLVRGLVALQVRGIDQ